MNQKNNVRFILVYRKTRMQELIERFNTRSQAIFYLEHNQIDVMDYLNEHDNYQKQLFKAEKSLKPLGRFQLLERSFLPDYLFRDNDVIICIGQDGLVANTLKYLNGQKVIAINPDPKRWDGKLLPFKIEQLESIIQRTINNDCDYKRVTLAEAITNDDQRMLAVNDLFIGPKSHTSALYKVEYGGKSELQSSSGIIISTGFGSTGWLRSILYGAAGIISSVSNKKELNKKELNEKESTPIDLKYEWAERELIYTVREPFPSQTTGTSMVMGQIDQQRQLRITSCMPENGVIFSDGIESDYINFNSGTVVNINVAQEQGCLVV